MSQLGVQRPLRGAIVVSAKVPELVARRLEQVALEAGGNRSDVVRSAVSEFLERHEGDAGAPGLSEPGALSAPNADDPSLLVGAAGDGSEAPDIEVTE